LATVQRMTAAYLRSALYDGDTSWTKASEALQEHGKNLGRVDSK
jgi:hypothetical protein